MIIYYLYRHIRNDFNIPFYIGMGKKPKNFNNYKSEYKRAYSYKYRNRFWQHIFNKSSFIVEILYEANSLELIKNKEKEFINLYGRRDLNKGVLCNLTDGADGTYNFSEEVLEKLRKASKGKSPPNKGKKVSVEEKKRLLDISTGRSQSVEEINKRKILNKNKHPFLYLLGNIRTRRKVYQYDLKGELITSYQSSVEASLKNKLSKGTISSSILKNRKTNGFIWSYTML